MAASSDALIIFIRIPELGKVKTRLANAIGDGDALRVYRKLLEITRVAALGISCNRFLYYTPEIIDDDWSSKEFQKHIQSTGDLGDRMAEAFSKALFQNEKALIIGSDCPEINAELLAQAFNALETHDVVIGPSEDGGYYLLGMKSLHTELFKDMPWSQEDLYEKTISCCKDSGLSVQILSTLIDVDHQEDLKKFPELLSS